MSVTSKIKSITEIKGDGQKWNGNYYHLLEMENGDKINIGKNKAQQAGWELTYEITEADGQHEYAKAKSIKPEQHSFNGKPQYNGSKSYQADPKKQTIIVAQSSMTKAIDILLSGVVPIEFKDTNDFVNKTEALTDLLMKKQIELTQKHYKSF